MAALISTRGRSQARAAWGQWLSAATFLLIAAQSAYLFIQGESYCPNTGCKIVEEQSPLSPFVMNAGGLVFFALLFALFWTVRRQRGDSLAQGLLGPLLLAGIAAEGVLFTFQYQTGSFCLYCCVILAAVLLLNIFLGGWQSLRALGVFAAVFLAAFLLTAPKGESAGGSALVGQGIDAGTLARRQGPAGAEQRYFFFAEDCAHCKTALAALLQDRNASLNLNPLAPLQELELPSLALQPAFTPEANRAFLTGLGIKTVPVLLVRQQATGTMQILLGSEQILAHLQGSSLKQGGGDQNQQSSQATAPQTDFLIPGNDGCSVDAGCSQ